MCKRTYGRVVGDVQEPEREAEEKVRKLREEVVAQVHQPETAAQQTSTPGASTALTTEVVVTQLEHLQRRVVLPEVQARKRHDEVMRGIQRLQERQLEQVSGQGSDLVVGEVDVCEVGGAQCLLVQERRQESCKRDILPEQVECSGDVDGRTYVLDREYRFLFYVHHTRVLPGEGFVQLLQFHMLEPSNLS